MFSAVRKRVFRGFGQDEYPSEARFIPIYQQQTEQLAQVAQAEEQQKMKYLIYAGLGIGILSLTIILSKRR